MVKIEKEYSGRVKLVCSNCGKKYITFNAWLKKSKDKYHCCSNACRFSYHKKYANRSEFKKRVSEVHKGKKISEKMKGQLSKKLSLENNPAWKGGVTKKRAKGNYDGVKYIRCPKPFLNMARKDGYIMEHRLVMAKHLKRLLKRSEVVHHKDHSPENNSISNLVLFSSNGKHKRAEGKK